jgi:hypothetical protein
VIVLLDVAFVSLGVFAGATATATLFLFLETLAGTRVGVLLPLASAIVAVVALVTLPVFVGATPSPFDVATISLEQ